MFGFDMLVHGVRGNQLPDEDLSDEELEVYGVDWEGLHDEQLLRPHWGNNPTSEGWNSWIGHVGLPSHYESLFIGICFCFIKPITLFHTLIRFTVGNLLLLIVG